MEVSCKDLLKDSLRIGIDDTEQTTEQTLARGMLLFMESDLGRKFGRSARNTPGRDGITAAVSA